MQTAERPCWRVEVLNVGLRKREAEAWLAGLALEHTDCTLHRLDRVEDLADTVKSMQSVLCVSGG